MGERAQNTIARLRKSEATCLAGAARCKRSALLPVAGVAFALLCFAETGQIFYLCFVAFNGALICAWARWAGEYLRLAAFIAPIIAAASRVHAHEGRAA